MRDHRRLERLYEGLGPREGATLAFTHLSRGNVAAADQIRYSVPLKVYRLPDPEHVDHFARLQRFTLYYAMERWRYQAHCFAASGIVVHFYKSEDEEEQEHSQKCFDAWIHWQSCLLSLDGALEAVCAQHGVDVADVRRMAGIEGPYEAFGPGEVDPELVAEMTKTFNDVLEPPR
jgi:hypothetical protein